MARKDEQPESARKKGRFAQIKQTYQMAKRTDRHIGWISLGVVVAVLAVLVVVGLIVKPIWLWVVMGLPFALLAGAVVFGRRAEKSAYSQIEGQPGAAMAALGTLRRGWDSTPVVATNRHQDVVHRVVGRPGVILVGEGTSASRVVNLLNQEKRRHARVVGEAPVYDVVVGNDEDQVPLRRLPKYVMKLPRNLRPAEVTELRSRLRALGTQPVAMPKGPLPRNMKIPRGGMPPR
ncbi:MAG TPA: DUF4191 domain-containing protein [Jiangellaceae bacterium]|jgi:Domain of unknown function (DUF4191)|nr:DUF4191 domain-containing protein [Jiangellaceae bacterium]